MDLFKATQRIPPRRIPMVRRYLVLPAAPSSPLPMPTPKSGATLAAVAGGVCVVALLGLFNPFASEEGGGAGGPGPRKSAASVAPKAQPSFHVIRSTGSGGGGGGGGGDTGPAAGPLVHGEAGAKVLAQIRKLIFTLEKDPSTPANMTDRLALFEKYFNSLNPNDRIALFGTIDFKQLDHAIRTQRDKGPSALDRCLAQLQLIIF